MKTLKIILSALAFMFCSACGFSQKVDISAFDLPEVAKASEEYNSLNAKEKYVIIEKGTERAFTGAYHDSKKEGVYLCKQCNNPLFSSADKFDSRSGWPSFDAMIGNGVKEVPDADGYRTEIVCANCDGHLGHVFKNEGFTSKMTRHCVNSLSLQFYPLPKVNSNK